MMKLATITGIAMLGLASAALAQVANQPPGNPGNTIAPNGTMPTDPMTNESAAEAPGPEVDPADNAMPAPDATGNDAAVPLDEPKG